MPQFLLLLLLLLLLLCYHGFPIAAAGEHSSPVRLELVRHPAPSGASRLEHVQELFRSDRLRQRMIHDRIQRSRHRRRACDVSPPSKNGSSVPATADSFKMPLKSGAYSGTGQYFVRFLLGTPAQRFLLVMDTGSDLTWVKCRLRPPGCRSGGNGTRDFHPDVSSSFKPIPCSSDMCKTSLPFSLTTCPTPGSPCAYDYGYSDGSTAQGVFANEKATIILSNGRRAKLRGLVVGCTSTSAGSSFWAADGVLGLGYSDISFAGRATARFKGRFSYCLVDHLSPRNASSFLTFGPNAAALPSPPPRETALVLDLEPFYTVGVDGISVDGELLAIPRIVWDVGAGGGAILDSGTSLTVLAEPAYRAVASALSRRLEGIPRVSVDPFDYCYNWTAAGGQRKLPQMVVHLAGSAALEPPAKSYVIDVAEGVKCLGIAVAPWPGVSTIGNILQQEHLWEFDLKNRRLRFRRSRCRRE
ncbi:Eukaryotic aspartyl protease [Musa troglodytarum]|uniref:Eukaryotic aspartyl protease n=1 Tax=Musa troglodytarum TaxID=320322 RepID=A0A9E7G763_9LILI|nr:Eukaryotic aspartyl protease [Musa troglodytarum]